MSYTRRLYPTKDSWCNADAPNTNYGSTSSLWVSSYKYYTYIQWDLSDVVGGRLTEVMLHLYCTSITVQANLLVRRSAGSWTEGLITYNNQPWHVGTDELMGSGYFSTTGDQSFSLNITHFCKLINTNYGLWMRTANGTGTAQFYSRTGSVKPYLDLTFDNSVSVSIIA